MNLRDFALFLLIVEKGSLTAAGKEMDISSTTVSERLAALEGHFGVSLLHRTTRALSVTDEGRLLVEGAKRVLREAEDLDIQIRLGADTLSGTIRISAPIDLGRGIVADILDEFTSTHPKVNIEFVLSDGFVDIVGEGIDLALRFGTVVESNLRIRTIMSIRRLVCASPQYLIQHGTPKHPTDLADHNCLVMRFGQHLDNVWHFIGRSSEHKISVRGTRIANDGALVRQWAIDGIGIVLKSELDVREAIQQGDLVELLPEYDRPKVPLQLIFPPGRSQPKRVKELAKTLVEKLQKYQ